MISRANSEVLAATFAHLPQAPTSPWRGEDFAFGSRLAPVTSPLVGEVGSRAELASGEGGLGFRIHEQRPPPHPSPTSGAGAACPVFGALGDSPAPRGSRARESPGAACARVTAT